MKYFLILLLASLLGAHAWAQSDGNHATLSNPVAPEQRRAELRSVLKVSEAAGRESPGQAQVLEDATANRRLSEQERVYLRQQLNQQRSDVRVARP
jgi:hypothetical protein